MANSRPVTATTSLNAFFTDVASRYTQVSPTMSRPTTTLAATGVANRREMVARNSGRTR